MHMHIEVNEFTEAAFRAVCERDGTTPERVLEAAVRNTIGEYLNTVASDMDTEEPKSFKDAIEAAKAHGIETANEMREFNREARRQAKAKA